MALNIHVHSKRTYVIRLWSMYALCFINFINVLKSAQLGLLLFWPQWAISGPQDRQPWKGFLHSFYSTLYGIPGATWLFISCAADYNLLPEGWGSPYYLNILRSQNCLCLLYLWGEMMLVPEHSQPPFHRGEVCASSHYFTQGRNSGTLQELAYHI